MTRRLLSLALIAVAALALSACGSRVDTVTRGESEADYVTLGKLQYQVQLSRQLNPASVADRDLLVGLSPLDAVLKPDEVWFGLWIRVYNKSGQPQDSAEEFKVVDTRGREYLPTAVDQVNRLIYRPGSVPDQGRLPLPGSAADGTPTSGALLLFKLPVGTLDFRPLEFAFSQAAGDKNESTVRLDV